MEYALMAIQFLAQKPKGTVVSAREISDYYQVSFEVLARVLQKLVKKGMVKSVYGFKGGYELAPHWSLISLYDLFQSIEGKSSLVKCIDANQNCEHFPDCHLLDPIRLVNQSLQQFYQRFLLADLLSTSHPTTDQMNYIIRD